MGVWRPTIVDASGRRVPLLPHDWGEAFRGDRERAARIHRASLGPSPKPRRAEWLRGIGFGLLALPVLLGAALLPAYLTFRLHLPWWGLALAVIPMGLLPAAVTVWLARRISAERIARLMLRAGYCPSCGFDLEHATPDALHRRVCPECAACWTAEKTTT